MTVDEVREGITGPMCDAFRKGEAGQHVSVTDLCAMPDYVREAYQMGVEAMRKERAGERTAKLDGNGHTYRGSHA